MKTLKKALIIIVLILLYLASTVPVGLFLYSLKSAEGLNVFSKTGFHSYMHCLKQEAEKIGTSED